MPGQCVRSKLALAGAIAVFAASGAFARQGLHTPAKNDPERAAILDGLRHHGENADRIFDVRALRVRGGWAWVTANPRSRDGRNRYEPESALLREESGRWSVVDQPCGEEDCSTRKEVARMKKAWPAAPADIFPK